MSKNVRIALGIATFWPFVYIFIFFAFIISTIATKNSGQQDARFAYLIVIHFLTMFMMLGLVIVYIVDVFKNNLVNKDQKVLWAVVLFFGGMFAMPVYWYMFLWKPLKQNNPTGVKSCPGAINTGSVTQVTGGNATTFCPMCGGKNMSGFTFCTSCGRKLYESITPEIPHADEYSLGYLIPYKNTNALIAYYFGVFSLIPLFPIGITGLILGLKGLSHARRHPESRGATHAWVGIIAGGIFGIGYFILSCLLMFYLVRSAMH